MKSDTGSEGQPVTRVNRGAVWMLLLAILAAGTVWAGVNEWTNVGPGNGGAGFLVFDPRDPATVYAGTSVGVFKSRDRGASWSNAGLIGWAVASLAIDPRNPSTLYAVTVTWGDDFGGSQVFKSTDGGASWNEAGSGLPSQRSWIQLLVIAPQNTDTLYALTGGDRRELFKSTDGGESWAPTAGLPGRLYFLAAAVDPQNSSTLYAAANGVDGAGRPVVTVFKSKDGGASWNKADSGLPGAPKGIGMIQVVPSGGLAIDPTNSSTLYATMFGIGVYKSTDGGASWRAANSGLPNLVGDYEFMSCCTSGVVIDPQSPNTLYASGSFYNVIFKSTNGGASWKAASTLGASAGGPLTIDPHTGALYKGPVYAPGLFLKSADGATWSNAYFALRASPVSSLALDPKSSGTVYAGAFKSTDAGMSWSSANMSFKGSVVALAIDPLTPNIAYAGTIEHKVDDDGNTLPCDSSLASGIFKSVDGGMNWVDTRAGIGCLLAIAIDPRDPSTVYAGSQDNGVYKSTDGGTSWNAVNSGLPRRSLGIYVSALAVDPKNPGTLYAGSDAGLFKSKDAGASWSNAGLTPGSYALAIDPLNASTVYAATSSGLFKSTDGGASWRNLFPSLPANVYAVAINPRNPSTICVGTGAGVAQSTDGGESWTPIPGGPRHIRLLALDPQDPNTVYAGGPGGLFAISLDAKGLDARQPDISQRRFDHAGR
jgi:photosystem II stability/assembly factor-like uncharacterized protein